MSQGLPAAGISKDGRKAEDAFILLVPSARKSDSKAAGDCVVTAGGEDYYIEVKKCGTKGGTVNQVRPIKFIPLVVRVPSGVRERAEGWYVIPPDRLLRDALGRNRGQHSELSLENMTVSLYRKSNGYESFRTAPNDVAEAVERACLVRRSSEKVLILLDNLKGDLRELVERYRTELDAALNETSI